MNVIAKQQAAEQPCDTTDDGVPPEAAAPSAPTGCFSDPSSQSVNAYFTPSGQWRRPSDYIQHLVRTFEHGKINQKTCKRRPRPLKRDQVLFVAQFAHASNVVWQQERDDVPMS